MLAAALGSAAGGLLLRPLLSEAQGATPPQRVLLIHRPCGSRLANWFPDRPGPLGDSLPPLLESFRAVKDKMLILRGVDAGADHGVNGDKHAMGSLTMLTGHMPMQPAGTSQEDLDDGDSKTITAAAPSLDQFLLQQEPTRTLLTMRGADRISIPSIQLAGTERSAQGSGFRCLRVISYAEANQPLWGEARTDVAFDNIFGQLTEADPEELERLRAQRRSIFDLVQSDLTRIRAQVPASQIAKLDAHEDAIRQLETSGAGALAGCMEPTLGSETDAGGLPGANEDETRHEAVSRNMLSIIKSAFQCDITRVASLTFADGNNGMRPKMYVRGGTFQMESDHHGVSHAGDEADSLVAQEQTDKFYGDMVGQMLAEMDQIPEGDPALGESLLDHTLVIYFSECSDGDCHDPWDIPVALFGGKFLNLNVGSYVDFERNGEARFCTSPIPRALFINDVWTTLLNAWGMSIDRYGDPEWTTGSGPNAAPGIIRV